MTPEEDAKVTEQVRVVSAAFAALPLPTDNDGLVLFEAARTLVDEACGIMTVLCEVWSARKPERKTYVPSSRPKVTTDDLLID
jgi:hypothetical protein